MLPSSVFFNNSSDFKDDAMKHLLEMQRITSGRTNDNYYDEDSDNEEFTKRIEEEYFELQNRMNEIFELNEKLVSTSYYDFQGKGSSQYNYPIESILMNNFADYLKTHSFPKKIHICLFQVNNSGLKPFLQFFLRKCPQDHSTCPNKLSFITIEGFSTFDSVVNKTYKIMEVLFLSYMKVAYYQYKGFIENANANEITMFYDCTNSKVGVHSLHSKNDLWLTLIDEIVNQGNVCDQIIDPFVKDFFIDHPQLIHLKDENNNVIENPTVAYSYAQNEQIEFMSVFGVSRNLDLVDALVGPYFYFTNYENAKNEIKKSPSKKNGILRFALFLGNNKVPMNLKDDTFDTSEKTQQLLLKDPTTTTDDYKIVRDLLKLSDRDGKWAEHYDSIFICNFEIMEECKYKSKLPYWVIKTYEQQTPLTYHIMKV